MVRSPKSNTVLLAARLIVICIIIYALHVLQDFLVPMLFSAILAFLLVPVVNWLEQKNTPRVLAIIITILLAVVILIAFFSLIIAQIRTFDEIIPAISQKVEVGFARVQDFARSTLGLEVADVVEEGKKSITSLVQNSSKIITSTLSVTTSFLANFSLLPLYIFLMLLYRDFFLEFLYRAFKSVSKHKVKIVVDKIKDVLQSYMSGLILVILIVGTLNSIALLLLGIEHAIFFGFFAAFLVLIPYIGIAIGALLPILLALITKDSAWYAFGVAASFGAIQFLEGNFITPYIVGSKISINAFMAIISLILFGSLWGISGLVLALPLTAIIKVIFDSVDNLKPYGFLIGETQELVKRKSKRAHKTT